MDYFPAFYFFSLKSFFEEYMCIILKLILVQSSHGQVSKCHACFDNRKVILDHLILAINQKIKALRLLKVYENSQEA